MKNSMSAKGGSAFGGKKYLSVLLSAGMLFTASANVVSAHVVVSPKEAGVGKFITFSLGVPVEKEVATTGVRLVIPAGLNHVTPNVKPGWNIEIKKSGDVVSEIVWTGGAIPAGQRDDFLFSGQVPGEPTVLAWKAYQTYADGTVVSWDQEPAQDQPYSVTSVIEDIKAAPAQPTKNQNVALTLSLVALALAIVALGRRPKA